MSIPYLPLLQGDDHTDIAAIYNYLNAVIAAFVDAVNEAVTVDTVNDAVNPATFASNSITLTKLQQLTATRLLGRGEGAGVGDVQQLTVGTNGLLLSGTVLDTALVLDSGTYTPTLVNVANLDASTAFVCQYMRVGNVVTVSGRVQVDPTTIATSTVLRLSLPIPSSLTAPTQCSGVAYCPTLAAEGAAILGDTTNDAAAMQWVTGSTTNRSMQFTFTYLIIAV